MLSLMASPIQQGAGVIRAAASSRGGIATGYELVFDSGGDLRVLVFKPPVDVPR